MDRLKKTRTTGRLHPNNPHAGRYDFAALVAACPELEPCLRANPKGDQTIDFSDEEAVRLLNRALLAHHYGVENWMIPKGYLCPPIPGRADAIHYLAEFLAASNGGEIPRGKEVRVLDVGTGANCIYPILGSRSYGWKFVATDIDPVAVKTARLIVASNPCLANLIKVVQQKSPESIFRGIIRPGDRFDLTMCNPPFHASMEDALASNQRKRDNLSKGPRGKTQAKLNFGGQKSELWCEGGERRFVSLMIRESAVFGSQVGWFSSLISKSENLPFLKEELARCGATQVEVLSMSQGQKVSRLLVWKFD